MHVGQQGVSAEGWGLFHSVFSLLQIQLQSREVGRTFSKNQVPKGSLNNQR